MCLKPTQLKNAASSPHHEIHEKCTYRFWSRRSCSGFTSSMARSLTSLNLVSGHIKTTPLLNIFGEFSLKDGIGNSNSVMLAAVVPPGLSADQNLNRGNKLLGNENEAVIVDYANRPCSQPAADRCC